MTASLAADFSDAGIAVADAMRPRDAATLIILRERREVLLGVRSAGHVFMPHNYVFPGGRVDAGDARVPCPVSLRSEVEAKLLCSTTAARARALGMAAIRETWEETGLAVGHPTHRSQPSRSAGWRAFFAEGYVPALDRLDYFARAITPPGRVRRFDARFFTVDAQYAHGQLAGNGELEDLHWVGLEAALELKVAPITGLVLRLLRRHLEGRPGTPMGIPTYRQLHGRELIEYQD